MAKRKFRELVFDILCLMVGIMLFVAAQGIDVGNSMGQGADFLPKLCSLLWIVVSIGQLYRSFRMDMREDEGGKFNHIGFWGTIILLLAYVFVLPILGFVITSMIYLFAQMMLLMPVVNRQKKNFILVIVLSILTPIAIYWLFENVFGLLLPSGIFLG